MWVYIPSGTSGTDWKCRLGVYRTGTNYPFIEQSTTDVPTITARDQWVLCTWDLNATFYYDSSGTTSDAVFLDELRRFHVRVGANNVNSSSTVYIDTFSQGLIDAETGVYVYDPAPSNGTDVMTLEPAPDQVMTDSLGSYAVYNNNVIGYIRLGKPTSSEYVPADSVGSTYSP